MVSGTLPSTHLLDEAQVEAPEVHVQVVEQAAAKDALHRVSVACRKLRFRVLLPVDRLGVPHSVPEFLGTRLVFTTFCFVALAGSLRNCALLLPVGRLKASKLADNYFKSL